MSDHAHLYPRQAVPELKLTTTEGESWTLRDQSPENFTLVVFYRGYHCPVCAKQLRDLESKLDDFAERGVNAVAVSGDTEERAKLAKDKWKLERLKVAYGLGLEQARSWGLFISQSKGKTSTGVEEPELFSEPALYLVRPDGTLYFGSVQTMPFARPRFEDILSALDSILKSDYPARGEVVDYEEVAA